MSTRTNVHPGVDGKQLEVAAEGLSLFGPMRCCIGFAPSFLQILLYEGSDISIFVNVGSFNDDLGLLRELRTFLLNFVCDGTRNFLLANSASE